MSGHRLRRRHEHREGAPHHPRPEAGARGAAPRAHRPAFAAESSRPGAGARPRACTDKVTDEALERAEPIRAYRAWRHRPPAQSARLESFGGQTTWTPKRWMRAECKVMRAMGTHAAPASGCSCGIYATKDLALVAGLRLLAVVGNETSVMIGIVELADTIIEHDFGYRAEYARVAALLPRPGQESAAEWIAAVYGVPVSSQLIDQWDDLPQPTPSAKARIPPLVSASVTPAPRPTHATRGSARSRRRWPDDGRHPSDRGHRAGTLPGSPQLACRGVR